MAALQQTPPPIPMETSQFDFWVGDWTCETKGPGNPPPASGTNSIRHIMDGHVVQENFKMGNFVGTSVSVFNPKMGKWQQTWVDNNGAYLDLVGEFKEGEMTLTTVPKPKAPLAFNRMIFYDITKSSFMWDWEGSTDGGKTWTLSWRLAYKRKA